LKRYMMNYTLEHLVQYGIAGVALFMMYSITYKHLTTIQTTLVEIGKLLERILTAIED